MNQAELVLVKAQMRAQIKYSKEVERYEDLFFQPVCVQLKEGYVQVDSRGRRLNNIPVLECTRDEETGGAVQFALVVETCIIQPSPHPEKLRLLINPGEETVVWMDVDPSQIQHVMGAASNEDMSGGGAPGGAPGGGGRIHIPQ